MFLEILTRHYTRRPGFLAQNRAALAKQTDPDFHQTLLVDEVGRGVPWANRNLGAYAPKLLGEWVFVLDDDDVCVCDTLVADLKAIVAQQPAVELIYVRGRIAATALPSDREWGKPPICGRIGMSNFVVRRDVWQAHAHEFPEALCADYAFVAAVHAATAPANIHWHDCVVMQTQRVSRGAPE